MVLIMVGLTTIRHGTVRETACTSPRLLALAALRLMTFQEQVE
jgi:hypothetical protein